MVNRSRQSYPMDHLTELTNLTVSSFDETIIPSVGFGWGQQITTIPLVTHMESPMESTG